MNSARPSTARRVILSLLATAALVSAGARSSAEEAPVPIPRQAELLARVAAYDRNLAARAAGHVKTLIVTNDGDGDSRGVGAAMESAMRKFDSIGGMPSEVASVAFRGGAELAAACRAGHVSIVYVTPGLDAVLPEIVGALDGVDVLTVAAIPRFVAKGLVFGIDLVSGRPTLMLNLAQAKRQNVAFDPNAVRLMQVIK